MQRDSVSIYYLRVLELTWIRTRLCPLQSEDGEYWCRSLHRPEKLTHPNIQYVIPIDADLRNDIFHHPKGRTNLFLYETPNGLFLYPSGYRYDCSISDQQGCGAGSANIFPPGSGSAFNMHIQIQNGNLFK